MNTQEKYYTPTIEEFHSGFEYEFLMQYLNFYMWQKRVVEPDHRSFENYFNYIENNSIRVKYLDREDIESLGWAFFQKDHFGHDEFVFKTTVPDSMDSPEAT